MSESPPPSPEKVARRAIILSVVTHRGIVDGNRANQRRAADLAKRAQDWLAELGLVSELDAWEERVLGSGFGSLTQQDRINASWLSEGLLVLVWALGKINLPAFDEMCDPAEVANSLGFLQSADQTALANPTLRRTEVLREYNEFVYHLHWRIRDFALHKSRHDFEELARSAWGEPILRHGLQLKNKDVCVGGLPLFEAKEGDRQTLASITQERHRASNWLIGYASENFYAVTTDT